MGGGLAAYALERLAACWLEPAPWVTVVVAYMRWRSLYILYFIRDT